MYPHSICEGRVSLIRQRGSRGRAGHVVGAAQHGVALNVSARLASVAVVGAVGAVVSNSSSNGRIGLHQMYQPCSPLMQPYPSDWLLKAASSQVGPLLNNFPLIHTSTFIALPLRI